MHEGFLSRHTREYFSATCIRMLTGRISEIFFHRVKINKSKNIGKMLSVVRWRTKLMKTRKPCQKNTSLYFNCIVLLRGTDTSYEGIPYVSQYHDVYSELCRLTSRHVLASVLSVSFKYKLDIGEFHITCAIFQKRTKVLVI